VIYLDHAATAPLHPAARRALLDEVDRIGNPSSVHGPGRAARRTVEEAREALAEALGARPSEVVVTSGGTEADNLAIKGLYWARRGADPARRRVLVSAVEHHAVLDPARWLAEHEDAVLVELPVDRDGVLVLDALHDELRRHGDEVALVSVMWANNEVGALQPIADVVAAAHAAGVPVHADAVQALGQVPLDFAASGLDAMTVSGHKVGAPVGVGALLARRELDLVPVQHGGGQERGVRSGTLAAPLVAAFAAAARAVVDDLAEAAPRMAGLRDRLVAGALAGVPGATLRGPSDPALRLPANAHLTVAGAEGDSLLFLLDSAGIAVSTGSACRAGVAQPSHVLTAMGVPDDEARGALRFSLGRTTTAAEIDAAVAALPAAAERARAARGLVAP
jgi:cysteine desulfurase